MKAPRDFEAREEWVRLPGDAWIRRRAQTSHEHVYTLWQLVRGTDSFAETVTVLGIGLLGRFDTLRPLYPAADLRAAIERQTDIRGKAMKRILEACPELGGKDGVFRARGAVLLLGKAAVVFEAAMRAAASAPVTAKGSRAA